LFVNKLLGRFLGLGWPAASTVLTFCLKLFEVFRAPFCDLLSTFPPKRNGGGILFFRQSRKVWRLSDFNI